MIPTFRLSHSPSASGLASHEPWLGSRQIQPLESSMHASGPFVTDMPDNWDSSRDSSYLDQLNRCSASQKRSRRNSQDGIESCTEAILVTGMA